MIALSRLLHTRFGFLTGLFLLALAARLVPLVLFGDLPIDLDMLQYDMLARSMASGNGYRWYASEDARRFADYLDRFGFRAELPEDPLGIPTSFRAPLYPFLLSLVYRSTSHGGRILTARIVQTVLGAITVLLTYSLAQAAGLQRRSSQIAGMIVAFYSLLLFYPIGLVTENLFIPLLLLTLLATMGLQRSESLGHALIAGLLAGLTALTRSLTIILWPVLIFWMRRSTVDRRKAGILNAIMLVGMLLVTVPWSVRNSRLHGEPVWLESSLGYVLYLGYHPSATGKVPATTTLELLTIHDDMERNRLGMQSALNFILSDPPLAVRQVLLRFGTLWGLEWREFRFFYQNNYLGAWPSYLLVITLLWFALGLIILLPFAIYGMFTFEPVAERQLLIGVLSALTLIHTLTLADPRYHLPLVPILAVFAARGCIAGLHRHALKFALVSSLPFLLIWTLEVLQEWHTLQLMLSPGGNLTSWGY